MAVQEHGCRAAMPTGQDQLGIGQFLGIPHSVGDSSCYRHTVTAAAVKPAGKVPRR
jgi:hypothetical protein